MAENNVVFSNNTTKLLYPKEQHFWSGTPVTAPGRIPPGSTAQGKQQATAEGALKFATVYTDREDEIASTRKFISAFDIAAPQVYGPYGSDAAKNYSITFGEDESVTEIIVRHGFIVDAIGFVVADKTGATSTNIFGGNAGVEVRIPLEPGREYITQIKGKCGNYAYSYDSIVVTKIYINTNLKQYGPFGSGEFVYNLVNFESPVGTVTGFFGSKDKYIDSIGVYQSPTASSKEYGPFGSAAAKNYSITFGEDESITEVIVKHGFIVDAIGFVVADKTGATSTKIFGGDEGEEERISLQPGREYITQITGKYGNYSYSYDSVLVSTLYINTNLKQYGPFGTGEFVYNLVDFESAVGKVTGFFGRKSNYIDSIGVNQIISPSNKAYAESGPFGPIDWNVVEVKLGRSKPSVVYVDNILGSKVEATVTNNANATVVISES